MFPRRFGHGDSRARSAALAIKPLAGDAVIQQSPVNRSVANRGSDMHIFFKLGLIVAGVDKQLSDFLELFCLPLTR